MWDGMLGVRIPEAQPTLVVFGASGAAGIGVTRHMLKKGYRVKIVTRKPAKPEIIKLAGAGAEVVKASEADPLRSFRRAVAGASAVFASLAFREGANKPPGADFYMGCAIAEAAKEAGVRHFVWAGLPDVEAITKGRWDVPAFTERARVWGTVRAMGFPACTSVEAAFDFADFAKHIVMLPPGHGQGPNRIAVRWPLGPDDVLAGYNAANTGLVVASVLGHPQRYNQKRIGFGRVYNMPVSDWMGELQRVTGLDIQLQEVHLDADAPRLLPELPFSSDTYGYWKEFGYYGGDPGLLEAHDVAPLARFHTWPAWLLASGWLQMPCLTGGNIVGEASISTAQPGSPGQPGSPTRSGRPLMQRVSFSRRSSITDDDVV